MLSSKRLNENYNDLSVRFDKLDYFSLLLLRSVTLGPHKLSLYNKFSVLLLFIRFTFYATFQSDQEQPDLNSLFGAVLEMLLFCCVFWL